MFPGRGILGKRFFKGGRIMRDPFAEKLNREKHRRNKIKNFHNLVDCFDEEMSDLEIAQELDISPEEVRRYREQYES
jgi:DNA-directed RNA polymerase specialized sigma subunit